MPRRKNTPLVDEHVSETDLDDAHSLLDYENDENVPVNDESAFTHPAFAPLPRSSSLLALRTPLSHTRASRASRDTPLRDITDQFFHPPSPSPVRMSKLEHSAPHTIEPPKRPKKPRSLAYPADPPNWLHSRTSSSLPPSSPFPPSTANVDHARSTGHLTTARHEYHLGTPSKASDSDPFGFVAVERALKAKRAVPALAPHKPTSYFNAVKSPPRSTVLSHIHSPPFASFSQLDAPVPTNNEDIEGLYADEPVAGPSHVHLPVAPLLISNADQPSIPVDPTCPHSTFPDPLRTPRKRKRRTSLTPGDELDPDEEGTDVPSSPSPVKVSVGVGRPRRSRPSHTPVPKLTRAQTRAAGVGTEVANPATRPLRTKRVKTSDQHIPTPSSTPASMHPSSDTRQSTAPPTPAPPRRSTRRATVGARSKIKDTTITSDGGDRMKLRSRYTKVNPETKATKPTTRAKHPPSKSRASTRSQKAATAATETKLGRGRPKGKGNAGNAKGTKGKGKTRPLKNVLDLSDDTRQRYEGERRERLEYFKRLEGFQIQKENVYVV